MGEMWPLLDENKITSHFLKRMKETIVANDNLAACNYKFIGYKRQDFLKKMLPSIVTMQNFINLNHSERWWFKILLDLSFSHFMVIGL